MGLTNLGPAIRFYDDAQADPAPTRFLAGIGVGLVRSRSVSLVLAYDASRVLNGRDANGQPLSLSRRLFDGWTAESGGLAGSTIMHNFGGELWLFQTLALRAGGFYQHIGALTSESGKPLPTVGAGLRDGGVGFDFSYIVARDNHPLANTMRFSLNVEFE